MSVQNTLEERSGNCCELCGATENLSVYEVSPSDGSAEQSALLCSTCQAQIDAPETMDANHWRCLNDSMWNPNPAVQVLAYRALHTLKEDWTQGLIDMMYLDEDTLKWAQSGINMDDDDSEKPRDCNGTELNEGDDVTLAKDLNVKGGGFTAKRGTMVKGIRLTDNPKHIEGKINGTVIVLVAEYLKKA